MKLIDDWNWVLRKAWSVRLLIVAAVLTGFETLNAVISAYGIHTPIPEGAFAIVSGIVSAAALLARFFAQEHDE